MSLSFGTDDTNYSSESDVQAGANVWPVALSGTIEGTLPGGTPPDDGDRHQLIIDTATCILYESWLTMPTATGFQVANNAVWDLKQANQHRPTGYTSADAAGLPIMPGLLKYDEAAAQNISHALRFTLKSAPAAWVFPGNHNGPHQDTTLPPYGTRFRLKANFDASVYTEPASIGLVKALKKYGLIFADQGSSMFISGVSDPRWDAALSEINQKHKISGSQFEAVQSPYPVVYGWTLTGSQATCQGVSTNTPATYSPPATTLVCPTPQQRRAGGGGGGDSTSSGVSDGSTGAISASIRTTSSSTELITFIGLLAGVLNLNLYACSG